ncbi:MAG: hypothetical protein KBD53_05715 [Candidatus Omnitrophica bacterium]|nr:hypothetical protein [Candidatus Omnitrophota bacterium]
MSMPASPLKKILSYILIGILAGSIGTYFRIYPLRTDSKNDNAGKATLIVFSKLKSQVEAQVNAKYPQLSDKEKTILQEKLFKELLQQQSSKVDETIKKVTENIEQSSPRHRETPYLLESDPFHFYQLTEQLIETGHISDTIKGSKYLNKLMLAPKGHLEPITLHPLVGSYVFRILKLFSPDIDLMHAVSFTPIILSLLALIFFIWICYMLSSSLVSTFIGSVFFMCSPIFIKRSAFGWYDNDPYNLLFPLIILAILMYALKNLSSLIKINICIILLSVCMLGYALFWQGWMLLFIVVISAGILSAFSYKFLIKDHQTFKRLAYLFLGVMGLSVLLISLKFGWDGYLAVFQEGFKALENFMTPQLSRWPDLYISVGELHQASLGQIILITGGFIQFFIACCGLIISLVYGWKKKDPLSLTVSLYLTIFFLVTLYLSVGAQRFSILCLAPLSILFVVGLNGIIKWIKHLLFKYVPSKNAKLIYFLIQALLLFIIIIPLYTLQKSMPRLLSKIYNDTWDAALVGIRERTPENSIINAWWPPGHFIKATAHRRVTFDGATINFPQAYWLTRVYLSQSEREAIGLLRMLNFSANDAAEYLQTLGFSVSSSVAILRTITYLDEPHARLLLATKIPQKEYVDHLLKLTHSIPDPSYLFLYNELIEKNIQLAFIGKWNFKRIEEINQDPAQLKKVPNRKSKEYVQFLWDLAGGPFKYNTPFQELSRSNEWVLFDGNIKINLKTRNCVIDSSKFGKGIPQSIFYSLDGKIVEQVFDKSTLSYSVIFYEEKGKYYTVLLDRYLANSLIMRLYYFGDTGLQYFKNFIEESDLGKQTDIRVFKVDWEQFQQDQNLPALDQ